MCQEVRPGPATANMLLDGRKQPQDEAEPPEVQRGGWERLRDLPQLQPNLPWGLCTGGSPGPHHQDLFVLGFAAACREGRPHLPQRCPAAPEGGSRGRLESHFSASAFPASKIWGLDYSYGSQTFMPEDSFFFLIEVTLTYHKIRHFNYLKTHFEWV